MPDDSQMLAFLENEAPEQAQRGRLLAAMSDEELTQQWIALWRIWASRDFAADEQVLFDYVLAEMKLRGRKPPVDLVTGERQAVVARLQAVTDELLRDPERLRRAGMQLLSELTAHSLTAGR